MNLFEIKAINKKHKRMFTQQRELCILNYVSRKAPGLAETIYNQALLYNFWKKYNQSNNQGYYGAYQYSGG